MPLGAAITWLGHSAFHIQSTDGLAILIDPFIENPQAPPNARALAETAQLVLITHGHDDHIGSAVEIVKQSGATVLTAVEVARELTAQGVPGRQVVGFTAGGAVTRHGVTVTLTQAIHSSSLPAGDGRSRSVGEACGLMIQLPGGPVIYDTGDTCVFGDMELLADIYRPTILMLPIGDFYTMGPRQAARACELVNPDWIIPHHYATFPQLTGTPEALRQHLPASLRDRVLAPEPGETIQ